MELKDFISKTIVDIQQGVQEAIQTVQNDKTNGVINPVWGNVNRITVRNIREVNFDIAVTVSEKKEGGIGAGINVMGVKIGGDGSKGSENSNVSRINFTVPIIPPVTIVKEAK